MEPKDAIVNNIKLQLDPEWLKVAQGLSIVLGFDSFEDYVSDCIETNVRIYLMGGDNIDENFHRSYKYLGYESEEQAQEQKQKEQGERREEQVSA